MTRWPNHYYEDWHDNAKNRKMFKEKEKRHLKVHLNEFYICPSKLFDASVHRLKAPSSEDS